MFLYSSLSYYALQLKIYVILNNLIVEWVVYQILYWNIIGYHCSIDGCGWQMALSVHHWSTNTGL